jgi:exoribonuclease-2
MAVPARRLPSGFDPAFDDAHRHGALHASRESADCSQLAIIGRSAALAASPGCRQRFMASTHVLFEEDGAFKAGTVLSDAGASLQVEAASGKRTKVKSSSVMLRFPAPAPAELMQQAQRAAEGIDLDFLWECAPQDEFDFTGLADDYYGHPPSPVEAASLLFRLHASPIYFYRKGRGRYRPAPPDTLRAALAAVERRKEQAARIEQWAAELAAGSAPEPIVREAARLLVRPDKNAVEWKALDRACELTRAPPARVLLAAGAFADAHALHLGCFLADLFPQGVGFGPTDDPALDADLAAALADLPLAQAQPFSIDDSTTTEIDDCLSVQALPDGRLRVGVHIAAPALAMAPGDPLDRVARERMSTVYMPGDKITMLPDAPIERFSLEAGREVPALSLYVDLDAAGTGIESSFTRLERIRVAANLRHDRLDDRVTEAALEPTAAGQPDPLAPLEQAGALRALWRLTLALSDRRDTVRGKPEARHRIDFSFYVDREAGAAETVRIVQRRRDAPLDRIVAEMMILANATWGRLLADHAVPGIYRAQQPGGRVRMTTHPMPHQGLGVAQYGWATSPLRRYVDLVNQRQLIAVACGQAVPYAANDTDLFAVISAFDTRYAAYAEFQQRMERYWCLRWVGQQPSRRLEAVVVRDELVRLAQAPLYLRIPELPAMQLAAGRRIVVDVLECDELELSVSARFVEFDSQTAADDAELVELEDALDGVDEVPGPPQAEREAGGDAHAVAGVERMAEDDAIGEADADARAGPGEPPAPSGPRAGASAGGASDPAVIPAG